MIKLLPRFVVPAALLSILAVNAWADPGINLAWNDCASAGATDKTFACASNTGASTMYLSFIAPAGEDSLEAIVGVLDLTSQSGLIPSWWDLALGGCRSAKISQSGNFTGGPFTCADFWQGQATGGLQYESSIDSTVESTTATATSHNHARLRVVEAVPETGKAPADPNTEYYFAAVTVLNALTTGVGSCAGCATPMCIVFNSAALSEPAPSPDVVLSGPPTGGNNIITWQGAGANCAAVPVHNRTWGQIKSLYR